jgi:hypothetical protein
MPEVSIDFLTPLAGLVAVLCLVPLIAFARARAIARRRRTSVGLAEPRRRAYLLPLAAVLTAAVSLGLAAMQPVVSFDETRRVRTDAEVFIVLDTTRSMLASTAAGSPQRIARAKAVATAVQATVPSVPVGLASVTDRTLPHLFPTADGEVFQATLAKSIGIERPPPVHTLLTRVTSLEALAAVATQGFFTPTARRRVMVVLTDGESLPGSRARLAQLFREPPGIATMFVHLWERDERVFRGRTPEPAYKADPGARGWLDRLAFEVGGQVYGEDELAAIVQRVPKLVGEGPSVVRGERRRDVPTAPYLTAFAFLPLALVLWRRDR